MSEFVLKIYQEDGSTVHLEVGTAAGHARPYLHVPEIFAESEIDPLNGRARIGRINLRVIDPQTGATKSDRWLTEKLGEDGISSINGRRATLLGVSDGRVVQEGVCAGATLTDSFAGFELAIEDVRVRGVKATAFDLVSTTTILPRGVLDGWGKPYPDAPESQWLIPPTVPLTGEYVEEGDHSGRVTLFGSYPGRNPPIPPELVITDAMREVMAPTWTTVDGKTTGEFGSIKLLWRLVGETVWNVIDRVPYLPAAIAGSKVVNLNEDPLPVGVIGGRIADASGEQGQGVLYVRLARMADDATPLPTDGQTVEVIILHKGPASEKYPFHYEGTWGEYARNLLRGDYSPRDPRILYDEDVLLALDTPVLIRNQKPVDDLRDHFESLCKAAQIAPALNELGEVAPVRSQLPPEDLDLEQIDDTNAQAIPGWEHPIAGAVTIVDYKYPRYFRVLPKADPYGDRSGGDGLAVVSQPIRVAPLSDVILTVMGEQVLAVDGWPFGSVGGEEGQPISGDVKNELGWQLAYALGHATIDRRAFGGQSSFVRVIRSAEIDALKVGDWVVDARSWGPNYDTQTRGRNHLAEIVSIRDLNDAWREMRLLDAAPYANPIGQPTLGTVSIDSEGIISVEVDAVPTGGDARVDFAISETEPDTGSGLWAFLGRTSEVATLTGPPIPAGMTAWVRSRGEKAGRRSSAWTTAVSVTAGDTPRVLKASIEITEAGVATIRWTPNAFALGMRITYATHTDPVPGSLSSSVDVDADNGEYEFPIAVDAEAYLTAEIKPYPGFGSGSVSGTPGTAVRVRGRNSRIDQLSLNAYSLIDFREIPASAPGKRRFGFTRGSLVTSVWWNYGTFLAPWDDDNWLIVSALVVPLPPDQDWVEVDDVPADKTGALQVEPRLADLSVYSAEVIRRVVLYPVPPKINGTIDARLDDNVVDLYVSATPTASALPVAWEVRQTTKTGTLLASGSFTSLAAAIAGVGPATSGLNDLALPPAGKETWWAKFTDVAGNILWANDSVGAPRLPFFDQISQALDVSLIAIDFSGRVNDPIGLGGTLDYWVPADGVTPIDPTASPTGSLVISAGSMPFSFGPGSIAALDAISVAPGTSLSVALKFTASDGRSSGQLFFPLEDSLQGLVDLVGQLRAGSVHSGLVLASEIRPYFLGSGAPTLTPDDYETDRYFDIVALQPYVWDGSSWDADNDTPAYSYAPILRAGIVTAEVIAAGAVIAKLVGAERVTADNINIGSLELIASDAGAIVNGSFINAAGTAGLNLDASGSDPVFWLGGTIGSEKLKALEDGTLILIGYPSEDDLDDAVAGVSAIIRATSAPSTRDGVVALVQGDMWIDTDDGNKPYIWNGSSWTEAYTSIDGSSIKTGAIQSTIYTSGSAGWTIDMDGSAEFNDVTIRGTLDGADGTFEGTLTVDSLGLGNSIDFKYSGSSVGSISTGLDEIQIFGGASQLLLGNDLQLSSNGDVNIGPSSSGYILLNGLPTSNPGGSNRLWKNAGVLSIT